MKGFLLALVILCDLTGTVNYIWNMVKGSTRPHRTTRFVLFGVSVTNMIGAVSAHAAAGTLILSTLFLARGLILALLSIKNGVGGTSKADIACVLIAVAGIAAWKLSGNGVTALIFAIFADAVAYIPAVIKTWQHPNTESPLLYWLGGLAALIAVIHDGMRLSTIFQFYIVFACIAMLVCINKNRLLNSWKLKNAPPV